MPIGRFLLFSVLGSLPWNAALLLGGILLGANYEALYHAIRPFEIVIYVLVLIGIVVVIALWLRGRDRRTEPSAGG
jgi:membrane protein DedA with SNARE-associated domain